MLENDGSVISHIRREKLRPILLWSATTLLCYAFSVLVDFVADDWYFVLAAGTNLANGFDLSFTPGERVNAFTSPLNTLLTSLLVAISGNDQPTTALWLHRLLSASSLGVAVILLNGLARRYRFPHWAGALLCFALMLDGRILGSVTSGTSSGFVLLFVSLALRIHVIPLHQPWLWLGPSWGGLILAQPIAGWFAFVLALAFLLYMPGAATGINRGAVIRNYLRAVGLAVLVVTPWMVWALFNLGSAIPLAELCETRRILTSTDLSTLGYQLITFPLNCISGGTSLDQIIAPAIALDADDWPAHAVVLGRMIGLVACFHWLNPFGSRFGRSISLATCVAAFVLDRPDSESAMATTLPFILLSWISLSAACSDALKLAERLETSPQSTTWAAGVRGFTGLVICLSLMVSALTTKGLQARQIFINQGTLNSVGHWLNDNAKPLESVFLAQSGQVGYLSKLDLHDYPGMSSWQVMMHRQQLAATDGYYRAWSRLTPAQIIALGRKLEADWIVLRPSNAIGLHLHDSSFLADYKQEVIFTRIAEIEQAEWIPGRRHLNRDATRIIYRRRDTADESAAK